MPQLMQLQSGSDSCGVLTLICTYPDLWKPLFIPGINSKMQAEDFLEVINVRYSASQLKKEKEIDIFKFFCDVVQSYDSEGIILSINPILLFSKQECLYVTYYSVSLPPRN